MIVTWCSFCMAKEAVGTLIVEKMMEGRVEKLPLPSCGECGRLLIAHPEWSDIPRKDWVDNQQLLW